LFQVKPKSRGAFVIRNVSNRRPLVITQSPLLKGSKLAQKRLEGRLA
jgi:hypothetical protein